MKKILKFIFIAIAIFPLAFLILLIYATITNYEPKEQEIISKEEKKEILSQKKFTAISWNTGYSGLGSDMDFFYDGGTQTRCSEERTSENLKKNVEYLKNSTDADFFLLQEVDVDSKRSYHVNQYQKMASELSKYDSFFAKNYDVVYVPLPITSPMGKAHSGLLNLSKTKPYESVRHSFPGNYSWPKSVFMLDRCFMVNRHKLENGKDLLIINTHNSAFDDGSLRKQQMEYLKKLLVAEFEKGNYIVVGGDWNQHPPACKTNFANAITVEKNIISENYLPKEWIWVYDSNVPTGRYLTEPYSEKTTKVCILDFFLISPNIEMISIKTTNLKFENSDHQPVKIEFKLNK